MNSVKNTIQILLLLLCFLVGKAPLVEANTSAKNHFVGLTFKSHEVAKDDRTSLDLIPHEPLDLKGGFSMTFDLKLQKTSFGHVFRIIFNDSTSLDMFAFIQKGKISFVLNNPPKPGVVSKIDLTQSAVVDAWSNVSVHVGVKDITCSINHQTVKFHRSVKDFEIDKIFFGANNYKSFFTSDVPRMTIKHIFLLDKENQPVRNWDLSKHADRVVYDLVGHHLAKVKNGVWEIDRHIHWKKEMELTVNQSFPQIAMDTVLNRFFIATSDSLYIFHPQNRSVEKIKTQGGSPFLGSSSYLIYNALTNQLFSYSINQPKFITYDFKSNRWSARSSNKELTIQHHSRYIDRLNEKLVLFGGYGKFKYNSILSTHHLNGGDWDFTDFSKMISPRYLASLGDCGDGTFLLFGGFGSESGLQEQGPHNYYDLFKLNVGKKTCTRLGAIKEPKEHYNFGNTMVVRNDRFYTLAYRNDLQKSSIRLFEGNSKTLDYRMYGDTIPYCFLDRDSYCDLFLSDSTTLYAVVLQRAIGVDPFTISVYSLAFPPLNVSDIIQPDFPPNNRQSFFILEITLLIFLVLAFAIFLLTKKGKQSNNLVSNKEDSFVSEAERTSSCIHLLGTFKVLDRNGDDVSASFTTITRQLFALCLLESFTFQKGLSSKRLEELIWFDMDKFNATNNRNVNIRKLRIVLEQLDGISISKDSGSWEMTLTEKCFCDYKEVITLLNELKSSKLMDKKKLERIVCLAKSGTLLPDFHFEWIDKYKSHYSYLLIEVLMKASEQKDLAKDLKFLVDLSDVVLIHDPIDEQAIQIRCKSLYGLGQKGLSKLCFDKYCSDYKSLLNEEPKLTYESIL